MNTLHLEVDTRACHNTWLYPSARIIFFRRWDFLSHHNIAGNLKISLAYGNSPCATGSLISRFFHLMKPVRKQYGCGMRRHSPSHLVIALTTGFAPSGDPPPCMQPGMPPSTVSHSTRRAILARRAPSAPAVRACRSFGP